MLNLRLAQPNLLVDAIRIPRRSARARWGYTKVCRKAGEFALAIGAVYADPERSVFRAVMGATSGPPIVLEDAPLILGGARDLSPPFASGRA
jgi:aerobic carbon-monoxide dehydrogenase medium subunit